MRVDKTINYFTYFGLPVEYGIDCDNLTKIYFGKLRQYNACEDNANVKPDIVYLNTAYKTLLNPISRGVYFLEINGENADYISNELSSKMFNMWEEYNVLTTDTERETFQKQVESRISYLLDQLTYATLLSEFKKMFSEARFMNSFLEKVKRDVYSRN